MLVKMKRFSGYRDCLSIVVRYEIAVDRGVEAYAGKILGTSFKMFLERYFDEVSYKHEDETHAWYVTYLEAKSQEEFEETESKFLQELNKLIEAFKDYMENLPVIEEKEWVWK